MGQALSKYFTYINSFTPVTIGERGNIISPIFIDEESETLSY